MKNNKGFTLIELIVAMSIAAIFMVCLIALISPSTKIFNRTEDSSDARLLAESLLEEIRHEANLSTELKAGQTDADGNGTILMDNRVIAIDGDGYLIRTEGEKTEKLFDDKFYNNKTVGMTAKDVADVDNCVDMTLKIYSGGKELYSIDSQLKPVLDKSSTTLVAEEETGGGEEEDDSGGIKIVANATWPKPGTTQTTYPLGCIVEYEGEYYVMAGPAATFVYAHQIDAGPAAHPHFYKITYKVFTESDVSGGVMKSTVYRGDLFKYENGDLYVYVDNATKAQPPRQWPNKWYRCDGGS